MLERVEVYTRTLYGFCMLTMSPNELVIFDKYCNAAGFGKSRRRVCVQVAGLASAFAFGAEVV